MIFNNTVVIVYWKYIIFSYPRQCLYALLKSTGASSSSWLNNRTKWQCPSACTPSCYKLQPGKGLSSARGLPVATPSELVQGGLHLIDLAVEGSLSCKWYPNTGPLYLNPLWMKVQAWHLQHYLERVFKLTKITSESIAL